MGHEGKGGTFEYRLVFLSTATIHPGWSLSRGYRVREIYPYTVEYPFAMLLNILSFAEALGTGRN